MSNYLVCFAQYELQVEVTRCLVVPPNPSSWDSDWDYHGYSELEFEVVSGIAYDEAGDNPVPLLDKKDCDWVAEQYADTIEERLWAQLEAEGKEYDQ